MLIAQEDWVLCRVFHKTKSEDTAKLVLEIETTPSSNPNSLTLAPSSPTNQTLPFGAAYDHMIDSFSSSMAVQNPNNCSLMNLLQFSRETNKNNSTVTQISPKGDDGYGFIWDMDLEESSLQHNGVDGMRFEFDNNSMVML